MLRGPATSARSDEPMIVRPHQLRVFLISCFLLGPRVYAPAQSVSEIHEPESVSGASSTTLPDSPSAVFIANERKTDLVFVGSHAADEAPATPGPWAPLSARQKLDLFVWSSYAPSTFVATALSVQSLTLETVDRPRHGDFSQRYLGAYAAVQSSAFIENFLVPALMRQDPRYFRAGDGNIRHRVGYALSRILVTRNDEGDNVFNSSGIAGAFLSSAVSNVYQPYRAHSVDRTLASAAGRLASRAGMNVLREFWPDLRHRSKGKISILMTAYQP
jgi:hypothetical protein